MIRRCYDKAYKQKNAKYADCSVCSGWLYFSNFKKWVESQDWEGKELDKDILSKGSSIYSPSTCMFVDRKINMLVTGLNYGCGAHYVEKRKKYQSSVKNSVTGKLEYLGLYENRKDAESAYNKRKKQIIISFADSISDDFLASKLKEYAETVHD